MNGNWKKFNEYEANIEYLKSRGTEELKKEYDKLPFILNKKYIGEIREIKGIGELNKKRFEKIVKQTIINSHDKFNEICIFETELIYKTKIYIRNLGY